MDTSFKLIKVATHNPLRRARRAAVVGLLMVGTLMSTTHTGQARSKHAGPPKPKITEKQAQAFATKKIPGTVVSSAYESDDDHWLYEVILDGADGQKYRVEVNPNNGKVVESQKITADAVAQAQAPIAEELVGVWVSPDAWVTEFAKQGRTTWRLNKDGTYKISVDGSPHSESGRWGAHGGKLVRRYRVALPYEMAADGKSFIYDGKPVFEKQE